MNKEELKAYLQKVRMLETQRYALEKMKQELFAAMKDNEPIAPQKRIVSSINKPERPYVSILDSFNGGPFVSSIAIGIFATVLGIALAVTGETFGFAIFIAIVAFAIAFCVHKKLDNGIEQEYQKKLEKYESEKRSAELAQQKAEQEYQNGMVQYNKTVELHQNVRTLCQTEIESAIQKTDELLQEVYNQNVIFPKYRNLVAVSSLSEYLESGRCEALEGADGSYNLYEMELRQNIIIGQLDNIIKNTEQIRCNQFVLYQELEYANKVVSDALDRLEDNLSNYHTSIVGSIDTIRRHLP